MSLTNFCGNGYNNFDPPAPNLHKKSSPTNPTDSVRKHHHSNNAPQIQKKNPHQGCLGCGHMQLRKSDITEQTLRGSNDLFPNASLITLH